MEPLTRLRWPGRCFPTGLPAARPTSLGGRPATLYRFTARTLIITNPFAAFRPPPAGSRSSAGNLA